MISRPLTNPNTAKKKNLSPENEATANRKETVLNFTEHKSSHCTSGPIL